MVLKQDLEFRIRLHGIVPNRTGLDRLLFTSNRLEPIQVFTWNRSGTDQKLDLKISGSSFGSVPDWFQNGPVQKGGLSSPTFGQDPFGSVWNRSRVNIARLLRIAMRFVRRMKEQLSFKFLKPDRSLT